MKVWIVQHRNPYDHGTAGDVASVFYNEADAEKYVSGYQQGYFYEEYEVK